VFFSTKSDLGSCFLLADVSLAAINNSPCGWRRRSAARAASRQSNGKSPPGLPCAGTPQGTSPPCIPSNQSLIIRTFRTSVCAVVNTYRYKSREQKHSESQSRFRILSRRVSVSLPRPDFANHKMNSVSSFVSSGPKKTPSAACGQRWRFREPTGCCEQPEHQNSHC
jgi:hypothetical protein